MIAPEDLTKWYSGKALDVMRSFVLPVLAQASELGHWPGGVARKVKAALNKQGPAIAWGKRNEGALRSIKSADGTDGWYLAHAMQFGIVGLAPDNVALAQKLAPHASAEQMAALDQAADWARCFAPVATLVETLDSRRPRPTFVFKTLSPTVAGNVSRVMGVDLTSVRSPEVTWTWVKVLIKGKLTSMISGRILWPDRTRHGLSRFANGGQCEACGHGIRNAHNWVPLLFDATHPEHGTTPASLWVGKDCAKKLLACEVSGDAVYEGRP